MIGMGAILEMSANAFLVMKMAGAIYLVLTTTFAVCALISHAFYVVLISLVKSHRVARAKLFNRIVGGTFIVLGLGLLKTRHRLA